MTVDGSFEKRRTHTVKSIIETLLSEGRSVLRPGDVNAVLRARNMPMGTWEVRAEFTRLEAEGLLVCDAASGDWHLAEGATLSSSAG